MFENASLSTFNHFESISLWFNLSPPPPKKKKYKIAGQLGNNSVKQDGHQTCLKTPASDVIAFIIFAMLVCNLVCKNTCQTSNCEFWGDTDTINSKGNHKIQDSTLKFSMLNSNFFPDCDLLLITQAEKYLIHSEEWYSWLLGQLGFNWLKWPSDLSQHLRRKRTKGLKHVMVINTSSTYKKPLFRKQGSNTLDAVEGLNPASLRPAGRVLRTLSQTGSIIIHCCWLKSGDRLLS